MAAVRSSEVSRVLPVLVLAVTVLVLFFARDLLILFAFAMMLAFLLAPAVTRLEAARIPRVVAVAITGVLTFSIICGVGYVVARQLLNVARDLPAYRLAIQNRMASLHSPAEQSLEMAFSAVEDITGDLAASAANASHGLQQSATQPQPVRIVDPDRGQPRGDVDDRAAAVGAHRRRRLLQHRQRGEEVDLEDLPRLHYSERPSAVQQLLMETAARP